MSEGTSEPDNSALRDQLNNAGVEVHDADAEREQVLAESIEQSVPTRTMSEGPRITISDVDAPPSPSSPAAGSESQYGDGSSDQDIINRSQQDNTELSTDTSQDGSVRSAEDNTVSQTHVAQDADASAHSLAEEQPRHSESHLAPTARSIPVSSTVFVVNALETINASKEARKNKDLGDAVRAALANIRNTEQQINPELIFRPLQMATKSYNVQLQVTALDCIGKLISYSYFAFPTPASAPPNAADTSPLIERAIEAICDTFENEATANEIQQQIVKSLLAAVLDDKIVVHGAGLLKAVRQIYNIFIYSKSSQNQQIAQGSLTQMVATVFERVRVRLEIKEFQDKETANKSEEDLSASDTSPENSDYNDTDGNEQGSVDSTQPSVISESPAVEQKLTLQDFETTKTLDESVLADSAPTMVTRARRERKESRVNSMPTSRSSMQDDRYDEEMSVEDEDDIYLRDAFLVFRSLCKLSQKQLSHDQQQDLRSQSMRSKLLSLHLIHHVLNNFTTVFVSPHSALQGGDDGRSGVIPFIQIAKPHLCLSLSRNAASSVSRVYEVCCEIFWLCLKHLRVPLKKELEVFWKEVYLAVLEKRNAPLFQKQMFLDVLERLASDARALVEIYLNYDCDRTALDNMYQEIIEHLSRICCTPIAITPQQQTIWHNQQSKHHGIDWHSKGALFPSLATPNMVHPQQPQLFVPLEYVLKQQALKSLVDILSSLDVWSSAETPADLAHATLRASRDDSRESLDHQGPIPVSPRVASGFSESGSSTPVVEDDPSEIEKVRKQKTALNEAIKQFNFKPKRGVKALIEHGFIRSGSPTDIAHFLVSNDRLDKAMLGEYLGEGDEFNVSVMHAFVDTMDFTKRRFVDALRQFLQSFRLPGEGQKIDRFMLKFAERYLSGNPNAFANADTAYVLAYSVIMLNTDQHSIRVKGARMTPEDFIKNNRGINDGQDLPPEYLTGIFDEIANNEIVLNSEREQAEDRGLHISAPAAGLASRTGQVLANFGRDLQAERQAFEADKMANRTEQLFRTLVRAQKKSAVKDELSRFVPASNVRHVGSMFAETWMSFLSALSSQMQDAQNVDLIQKCLDGLRLAIHITCRFDLDTPRTAFVTALARFTNLGNIKEMTAKNLQALRILIEVAISEGNLLRGAWREILMCISQLDRLQLLSTGVDEGALPDVTRAQAPTPSNHSSQARSRKSLQPGKRPGPKGVNSFRPEVADETKSSEMVRGIDQIFTNTAKLSASGIVDFVKALTDVSWQEIQSSGNSDSPRMYSLQKLVEISYYNMTRVRIEWSRIWDALGDHFNQVGCHNNTAVVFFALDSLRQLSMRFMELEELPGFKFQKDFLKPFEYVMANNQTVTVKDMVLRCLIQMIQARGDNIRSGWKTMFGVFTVAASEQYEAIVNIAFDYTNQIYATRFGVVISQGSFPDLIICLKEFSKNLKFQKKSLQAIELLKSTVPKMLKTPECPLSRKHLKQADSHTQPLAAGIRQPTAQTEEEQFWYPVLMAYQDVLMTGEDLEVRSRSLNYLFETLTRYGGDFPKDFWETLWRQVLYPIFVVLQSKTEMSKAPNHEELSVWLSTTMIQALRNMISLFTHYFESLEHMLDRFLELLSLCICQENDTIARIGSNCLQQLILQNVSRFTSEHWAKIVGAFVELFNRTTAYELFSAAATMSEARPAAVEPPEGLSMVRETASSNKEQVTVNGNHKPGESDGMNSAPSNTVAQSGSSDLEDYKPQPDMQTPAPVVTAARRRFFNKIITNCVLQLLMIETVAELFSNDSVYAQIPSNELLRLMALLKKSYQFAKKFNGDKELRMALWRQGFMRQPPNLLKQESGSANTYVGILMRMYHDEGEERRMARAETEGALIP